MSKVLPRCRDKGTFVNDCRPVDSTMTFPAITARFDFRRNPNYSYNMSNADANPRVRQDDCNVLK
jgi:hypothetical protein